MPIVVFSQDRDEVLGAGQNENVQFFGVVVPGQPLVGSAGDGRERQAPAETEGSIAVCAKIRKGKAGAQTQRGLRWSPTERSANRSRL